MSLVYARIPYTLDPGTPLPEPRPRRRSASTTKRREEVLEMTEVHDEEMAGPCRLQTSGEDPEIIAVVDDRGRRGRSRA